MAPWDSPPTFKNADPCTGGADDYLRLLTREIIPAAEKEINGVPRWQGIAGYSLAGLFALYAIYQTELFSGRSRSTSKAVRWRFRAARQSKEGSSRHSFIWASSTPRAR